MIEGIQTILLIGLLGIILHQKGVLPAKPKAKQGSKVMLDSSGLIDGRLLGIAQAGFISEQLVVPQFILSELQLLADGKDAHKRERARFGLDMVHELQHIEALDVVIDRTVFETITTTDDKLLALAKQEQARLYTTDHNLAKIAAVEGVTVLNVNELVQALRPVALPGEVVAVKIMQKGNAPDQGVGYLEDGTMVVVDGALRLTGKKIMAVVERMHQTVAGKMIFARLQQPLLKSKRSSTLSKTELLRERLRSR